MNKIQTIINKMTIFQRKDGRLEGKLTIKGKQKSFYGHTKREVKEKAKEYLLKIQNGYIEPQKIKCNDYIEYWLINYKFGKIEPTSYTRLWSIYNCQIKDSVLGDKILGNITTKDIQDFIDEHANPQHNSKALARSGLKKIINLLNPCFNKAMSEGIIHNNPCQDVVLPSSSFIKKKTRTQFAMDDKEIEKFKQAALDKYKTTNEYRSRDAIVLLLILNLGLRIGECLALLWSDIDMDNQLIYINKTIQSSSREVIDGKAIGKPITYTKDSTKTYAGNRVLKLNQSAMFCVSELIAYDKRHNIHSKWVCCTHANTRNTERNMNRSLHRLLKYADIKEDISPHTLRHTFGSVLIRRGVNIEVISKLMGHANITITYNKYIHVLQEQQVIAMDMIDI